ncbi:MAG TPA: SusC/RagA family TonB-linked outer membrane protein [Flavitalea sp.]|nr:SusC/RagA family TonB-linked outer membrane protein [Flavitalea sp.]
MASTGVFAQQRTVTGVIKDTQGTPLPGVNVIVKGTSTGTTSDTDGRYTISANEGATTLVFSFIGFAVQEVEVGTRTTVDVSLAEDITELSEVVVTALGVQRSTKALQYSVTTVNGDNLTQARENSLANSLAGRVAGVNVTKIASGPAGSSRVIIRGNKSLQGNNQPLYVIDGIPMDNTSNNNDLGLSQAGVWGGSDTGDGMSSINPDDIESITVLKGGNAAALYGARAANGVINIVTKKGTGRKGIGIEFNSNYVFESINNLTDFQTKYGSGGMVGTTLQNGVATAPRTQSEAFTGWGAQAWGPRLDGSSVVQFDGVSRPYSYVGDNWARYYETGTAWTNSLAFTGGNETQNFRFSVSDLDSKGVIPNSGFDRLNASLSTSSKFGKKVTMVSKVMYSHEDVKNRPYLSDSPGNGILSMYYIPGNINVNDYRGDPNKLGAVAFGVNTPDGKSTGEEFAATDNIYSQNPWWSAYQYVNSDVRDRIITSGQLRYDITSFLYVQGRAGMDWQTRRDESITPQGTGHTRSGNITEGENRIREINLEYILGLDKTFGKVSVNAFFGGNRMRKSAERTSVTGSGFNTPFFHAINNVLGSSKNFSYFYAGSGINSLFGSAEIGYDGILFLTATGRQDWFSVLNPAVNSKFYPSVGASFVFSDAISTLPTWLSFGKFRASWAQVGNVTIQPYNTSLTFTSIGSHLGKPMASFFSAKDRNGNLPFEDLVPFTSTEFEFGFDLRFLENRLGLDLTLYSQKTTDDILNANISRASGFGTTSVNLGEMQNRGIEFLLSATPVKGNITWDVSLNFAKNKNKVISLIEGNDKLNVDEPRTRTVFVAHVVGKPFGTLTGLVQSKSPDGQLVFDSDGAPISDNKYYEIGNGVPDFTGGLNNSFTYKGVNLSFLIDFRAGGDIYSGTNVRMTQAGFTQQSLQGRAGEAPLTLTGVVQNGTDANDNPIYEPFSKTLTPGEAQNYWEQLGERSADRFVYDGSFVKLRQLTLGYSFPKSMLNRTPFQTLTFSFVGRNLAILFKNIDNVDPESSYTSSNAQGLDYFGMPATRSYGFNLKATF